MAELFKKMIGTGVLSVVSLLLFFGGHASAVELVKVQTALKSIFPTATRFEKKEINLTQEQVQLIQNVALITFGESHSTDFVVYEVFEKDMIIGFVFEDHVKGKWGVIRYVVGLSPEGVISQVVVLEYKEIRGRPVAKKRFLNQYKGKDVEDDIMLRQDIDGVTGATISSRSMTDGVRKIVHVYGLIKTEFDSLNQ